MIVSEGHVSIRVPDGGSDSSDIFFNPSQELNRDLTVAVLRTASDRWTTVDQYLDAMAATGIRGVRAAENGYRVVMNDWDPRAVAACRANLVRNGLTGEVTNRNANALMYDRRADIVDLDPFGSPISFVDAGVNAARKLLCVTATDTAPLCGAHFRSGVRRYSAVPRNTEYHAEMGVRVLLAAIARSAARHDIAVRPVLSHATRHYVRTYLALDRGATPANEAIDRLGHINHCPECLHRTATDGLHADPWSTCPNCSSRQAVTAGPVWLGGTSDSEFIGAVRRNVTAEMGQASEARRLLDTLQDELPHPTHYDQHRLCKRWNRPAESMDEFLGALRDAGFRTSRTHYGGTTFKTDATVGEMRSVIAPPDSA